LDYTVTQEEDGVLTAHKKRTLKIVVVEDWSDDKFEYGLKQLVEIKEEGAYHMIAAPSTDLGTGCMQPVEVVKRHYQFCKEQDINIWNIDLHGNSLYLSMGNLPQFDFRLVSKLMENKALAGGGLQRTMSNYLHGFQRRPA
jgi:hypothetical protein